MVHYTNYGVQYIFKLNINVDYFNIILPLCIKFRHMLTYSEIDNLIVVWDSNYLNDRFNDNALINKYIEAIHYCKSLRKLPKSMESTKFMESTNEDYYNAFDYSRYIKFDPRYQNITSTFITEMKNKLSEFINYCATNIDKYGIINRNKSIYDNETFCNLMSTKYIYDIISNENFDQICALEQQISTIELNLNEKKIIEEIEKYEPLKDIIIKHGFQLTEIHY